MSSKLWICLVNVLISPIAMTESNFRERGLFQLTLWEHGVSLKKSGQELEVASWHSSVRAEGNAYVYLLTLILISSLSSGRLPWQWCSPQQTGTSFPPQTRPHRPTQYRQTDTLPRWFDSRLSSWRQWKLTIIFDIICLWIEANIWQNLTIK